MDKIKDKPRFKAAKELESEFKKSYAKFLGATLKTAMDFALKNVRLQSNSGADSIN